MTIAVTSITPGTRHASGPDQGKFELAFSGKQTPLNVLQGATYTSRINRLLPEAWQTQSAFEPCCPKRVDSVERGEIPTDYSSDARSKTPGNWHLAFSLLFRLCRFCNIPPRILWSNSSISPCLPPSTFSRPIRRSPITRRTHPTPRLPPPPMAHTTINEKRRKRRRTRRRL